MARCENCGKENPATLCPSCSHHRKKEAQRAADEGASKSTRVAPPKPPTPPDMDDLRERLRRVKEALAE